MSKALLPIQVQDGYSGSIARSPLSMRVTRRSLRARLSCAISTGDRVLYKEPAPDLPSEEEIEDPVPGIGDVRGVDRLRLVTGERVTERVKLRWRLWAACGRGERKPKRKQRRPEGFTTEHR